MYNPIVKYLVLGTALLGLASCGGENHCYEGFKGRGSASKKITARTVFSPGKVSDVATDWNIPLETLLELNEVDSDQDIGRFDIMCIPKRPTTQRLLYK